MRIKVQFMPKQNSYLPIDYRKQISCIYLKYNALEVNSTPKGSKRKEGKAAGSKQTPNPAK